MTYSEYRNQFSTIQSFVQAYGSLTYDEVKALIKNDACPISIESFIIDMWHEARRIVRLYKIGVSYSENRNAMIIMTTVTLSVAFIFVCFNSFFLSVNIKKKD